MGTPGNQQIAECLREAADLLEAQSANPFRINAYRKAANFVAALQNDLGQIVDAHGIDGLVALPGIGKGIASAIDELLATGRWTQLERLRETLEPEQLFQTVPGIGPKLAREIHETLHVDTLEALEAAAYDGRLAALPGIGDRRLKGLRSNLADKLGRRRRAPTEVPRARPGVDLLLAVDREYRKAAAGDALPKIAPKRFNPTGEAWLPILHTRHGDWHFTALFSNTELAHRLGHTHDWVVIYAYDDHHQEAQHTVVTETHGALAGRRVVRGREPECQRYYANG